MQTTLLQQHPNLQFHRPSHMKSLGSSASNMGAKSGNADNTAAATSKFAVSSASHMKSLASSASDDDNDDDDSEPILSDGDFFCEHDEDIRHILIIYFVLSSRFPLSIQVAYVCVHSENSRYRWSHAYSYRFTAFTNNQHRGYSENFVALIFHMMT